MTKTTKPEPAFPDYRFESRDHPGAEWQEMPVTWMGNTDEVRAAIESLKGAQALVAKRNTEDGWTSHRVVT